MYLNSYRIPFKRTCGDEIELRVRHDEDRYTKKACIHMSEIEAYGVLWDSDNIGEQQVLTCSI